MPEKLLKIPKGKHKAKIWLKIMALSIRDYTVIKEGQAALHQGNVRLQLGVFSTHVCPLYQ